MQLVAEADLSVAAAVNRDRAKGEGKPVTTRRREQGDSRIDAHFYHG